MKTDFEDEMKANQHGWDLRTAAHLNSAFYDVAGFKAGKCTLYPPELLGLGEVKGKSMLHLQCHFGLDTLSWARRGALVTGLDFSASAIDAARAIAHETGISDAVFVQANVYDALQQPTLQARFPTGADIVFTSYGTIGWLPDLNRWAQVVAHFLKPGGIFFMADFHPVFWMFDNDLEKLVYPYFNTELIHEVTQGTYADRHANLQVDEYSWNHPISEILQALLAAGLQLEQFTEHPYSPAPCFTSFEQAADGFWYHPAWNKRIPVMYTIRAIKPLSS
jgi:SAM-dependent methyltransferase